jgi:outer membrane lipoprotein carrier protein
LKLVPRQRQGEYDSLILGVEPGVLQIRELITIDQQGGTSSFAFTRLKENVGLSDTAFTFKIPRGVDVIGDTDAR